MASTNEFPFPAALPQAEPVVKYLKGWNCDISKIRTREDLPKAAQNDVEFIERQSGRPITCVSVGSEQADAFLHKRSPLLAKVPADSASSNV